MLPDQPLADLCDQFEISIALQPVKLSQKPRSDLLLNDHLTWDESAAFSTSSIDRFLPSRIDPPTRVHGSLTNSDVNQVFGFIRIDSMRLVLVVQVVEYKLIGNIPRPVSASRLPDTTVFSTFCFQAPVMF